MARRATLSASLLLVLVACGGEEFRLEGDGGGVGIDAGTLGDGDVMSADARSDGGTEWGDGASGDAQACPVCPANFRCRNGVCVDAADEAFSPKNPSGNWEYGSQAGLGSSFVPYPDSSTTCGTLQFWTLVSPTGQAQISPSVFKNTGVASTVCDSSFTVVSGQLGFYPASGFLSVLKWTAPIAGTYDLVAKFTGLCGVNGSPVSTTGVSVDVKGQITFSQAMNTNGGGNVLRYQSGPIALLAGETISMVVDDGTDNSASNDAVGVEATITAH